MVNVEEALKTSIFIGSTGQQQQQLPIAIHFLLSSTIQLDQTSNVSVCQHMSNAFEVMIRDIMSLNLPPPYTSGQLPDLCSSTGIMDAAVIPRGILENATAPGRTFDGTCIGNNSEQTCASFPYYYYLVLSPEDLSYPALKMFPIDTEYNLRQDLVRSLTRVEKNDISLSDGSRVGKGVLNNVRTWAKNNLLSSNGSRQMGNVQDYVHFSFETSIDGASSRKDVTDTNLGMMMFLPWRLEFVGISSSPFKSLRSNMKGNVQLDEGIQKSLFGALGRSMVGANSTGMRRHLEHELFLDFSSSPAGELLEEIIIRAVLPIRHNMFLDLDEPFPDGISSSCSISILEAYTCKVKLLAPPRVIDIEQPSFASPQNMVGFLVTIKFEETLCAESSQQKRNELISVRFDNTVHFRYQMPLQNRQIHDGRKAFIEGPAISIISAWARARNQSGLKNYMFDSSMSISSDSMTESMGGFFRTHDVTGFDEDYNVVAFLTFTASIIGAALMMRSISEVSSWD